MTLTLLDNYQPSNIVKTLKPVKPTPLDHKHWPPAYPSIYAWRKATLQALLDNPQTLQSARIYYSTRPAEFIMDWMDTYDPRVKPPGSKWMPFVFFKRQEDVVRYIHQLVNDQESGLVEKCRDFGLSWIACAYSVWAFLFLKDFAIGWGSRKETLVDKPGDPDSLFEKMRLILRRLPRVWLPKEFSWSKHSTFMKLTNPANGSIIAGEAGDNIGRGGRKSAQPLDTAVLTPEGFKMMGDLQVGDSVIGSDGKPTKIKAVVDWGDRQVYKVTFSDGTSTECDGEHLWQVRDCKTRKNLKRSKQIRGPEWFVYDTNYIADNLIHLDHELNFNIPQVKPIQFKDKETLIDPYILGVLLGDGSIKHISKIPVSFSSIDEDIVEEVRKRLPNDYKLTKLNNSISYNLAYQKKTSSGNLSPLKRELFKYGLANKGASEKFIPDDYKFGSIKTRLEVLQGLMDTDGYVSKRKNAGKVCIALSCEKLIDDVKFIVESLGGLARKTMKKTTHLDSYILTINLPPEFPPFKLQRKQERVKERVKYKPIRFISNIEMVGVKPVRCIQVSNEDGLYTISHCILTHNCYFVDEAAHIERAEKVEAALGDTTNVRIDISSVNGVGNVFHRRRENGVLWVDDTTEYPKGYVRVFVADWRDHPTKDQEWYDTRKARYEREGMSHIFAQEVDRNYTAAVSNIVIPYEWIEAAVDAHIDIPYLANALKDHQKEWSAGLDVADEGGDRNALTLVQYVVWREVHEWGERDPGMTARRAIERCRPYRNNIKVQYDCIGVGSGVKTEYNRLVDDNLLTRNELPFIPWSAGSSVVHPYERIIPDDNESLQNRDFFGNLKAQAWWSIRTRFYKTFKARTQGDVYNPDELISIDSTMPLLEQLKKELAQPTTKQSTALKLLIEKKVDGMKSPNLADSGVMAFFPVPDDSDYVLTGTIGV